MRPPAASREGFRNCDRRFTGHWLSDPIVEAVGGHARAGIHIANEAEINHNLAKRQSYGLSRNGDRNFWRQRRNDGEIDLLAGGGNPG